LKGHSDRVISIRFNPAQGVNLDSKSCCNFASGSADGTVRLWSLDPQFESQKSHVLKGHEETVNFVEFHPLGKHLASSGHDRTWRLWDLEKGKEVLVQEGHSGAVYPISIH